MKHRGSCHCGKVAYEVEGEITGGLTCNCTMCQRKGSMLWFVPVAQFKLLSGEQDLVSYKFNKHVIDHKFCRHCGIHPFAEGQDPKGNRMAAINLRCIDDIDLTTIAVKHFDGRSM